MPGCQVARVTFVRVPTPGLEAADKGMMVIILGLWPQGLGRHVVTGGTNVTRASVLPGHLSTRASSPGQLGTRAKNTRARVGASLLKATRIAVFLIQK